MPLADGTFRSGAGRPRTWPARPRTSRPGRAREGRRAAGRAGDPHAVQLRVPGRRGRSWTRSSARAGGFALFLSDNNGLDWKEVATLTSPGRRTIDLQKFVLRRYDYRLRFVLQGQGTGLEPAEDHASHPVLAAGPAHAGPGRQHDHVYGRAAGGHGHDRRHVATTTPRARTSRWAISIPTLNNVNPQLLRVEGEPAEVTFADRHARRHDAAAVRRPLPGPRQARPWDVQVSFDGGQTFRTVDAYVGPTQGKCQYTTVADVPAGTRAAVIRWSRHTAEYHLPVLAADRRRLPAAARRLPAGEGHLRLGRKTVRRNATCTSPGPRARRIPSVAPGSRR